MNTLGREKQLLRAEMKKRLASFSDAWKEEKSGRLCAVLAALEFWPSLSALAAFLPLPDEPDLRPLLERALAEGKTLFLPRIDGDTLVFHRVSDLQNGLQQHAYGMSEPSPALPPADWTAAGNSVLFLVPGLAFDRRGGRLGRGKGFYDRFFGSFAKQAAGGARILGAAFSCQLALSLPQSETDFPLDGLVTDEGVFPAQSALQSQIAASVSGTT